jgi:hypothetical protein
MHGSRVKLNETPPNIPLFTMNNEKITLYDLIKTASDEQKVNYPLNNLS